MSNFILKICKIGFSAISYSLLLLFSLQIISLLNITQILLHPMTYYTLSLIILYIDYQDNILEIINKFITLYKFWYYKLFCHKKEKCIICWNNDRTHCAIPCGHYLYCFNCIDNLNNCAYCRENIRFVIRIYS